MSIMQKLILAENKKKTMLILLERNINAKNKEINDC